MKLLLARGSLFFLAMSASSLLYPLAYEGCCHDFGSCGNVEFGGEYLYWKAEQDRMTIGSFLITEQVGTTTSVNASAIKPVFQADSGFRIFASYLIPCSEWKVGASFTHMPSSASIARSGTLPMMRVAPNGNNFFLLSNLETANNLALDTAIYDWTLNANYLDVDFSRKFWIDSCLSFFPHIGVRTYWMKQQNKMQISGVSTEIQQSTTITSPFNVDVSLEEKMIAAGIEGGLSGEWSLGYGVSMLGHVGGSILYSQFKNGQKALAATFKDTGAEYVKINATSVQRTGTPTLDYFLGLQYVASLWGAEVNLHAGWEAQIVIDANQLADGGNLSLQGLTVGGKISY